MTRMTRTVVENADPSELNAMANSLDPVIGGIDKAAGNMHRTIHGLDWEGQARIDAGTRADSELSQMRRVSDSVNSLKSALREGYAAMTPMVGKLVASARNLESASFRVAQDWTVTDGFEYGRSDAAAASDPAEQARLAEIKRRRAEEARNATVQLTRLAQELEAADTACAAGVRSANEAIRSMAPVVAGVTGQQAVADLEAMRRGSATQEQLARLEAATNLTPAQLEALRQGNPANIPQGQFDYLSNLMGGLDGVSLQEMQELDDDSPGSVGDALRLMSMPNLQTLAGDKGGMHQVPVGVRTLLQDSPIRSEISVVGSSIQTHTDIPRLGDFQALNSMLSRGDQGLRLGADIDRGLLKQASEISGIMHPRGADGYYGSYDHRIDDAEVRQTVDAIFHNASGDHQAVADFLTGENMGVTVTDGGTYHAESHVLDLLQTKWEPDELGARSVIEWIGGAADDPGYEGEIAGRSISALTDIIVQNEHALTKMDLGGDSYTTFGQLNPEMAQTVARSTAPYIGNFFDLPDSLLVNSSAEPMGDSDEYAKLLTVLATDGTAGEMMVRSSSSWENHIAYEFGDNPNQPGLGVAAGQLHRAVDMGIEDLDLTLTENHQWNETVDYARRTDQIDSVLGLLQGSGVPGLADAATLAGPAVKSAELGPPPGDPGEIDPWETQVQNYRDTHGVVTEGLPRSYVMLDAYLKDHPGLVDRSWDGDGQGTPIDFFDESGNLDWQKVSEDPLRFKSFYDSTELGALDDNFDNNATEQVGGSRIDHTGRPEPDDSSAPPR